MVPNESYWPKQSYEHLPSYQSIAIAEQILEGTLFLSACSLTHCHLLLMLNFDGRNEFSDLEIHMLDTEQSFLAASCPFLPNFGRNGPNFGQNTKLSELTQISV